MSSSAPTPETPWAPADPQTAARLFASASVRWWLSGGRALDIWLGREIRPRPNADVSVTATDLVALLASIPRGFSAWASPAVSESLMPFADAPDDTDLARILVHDDDRNVWVLQVNVEDGTPAAWVYKRDPRLQLPWDRAVLDIDGVPTGAPEVQLVWKALRPRPEDDVDKDAVLAQLSDEARAWYERAILSIHPHSSWSIHVRSPFAPGKASWNRRNS